MRDEALAHARLIVDATDLPVSVDLERGFGDEPEVVAETIRLALPKWDSLDARSRMRLASTRVLFYDIRLAVERIVSLRQACVTDAGEAG